LARFELGLRGVREAAYLNLYESFSLKFITEQRDTMILIPYTQTLKPEFLYNLTIMLITTQVQWDHSIQAFTFQTR